MSCDKLSAYIGVDLEPWQQLSEAVEIQTVRSAGGVLGKQLFDLVDSDGRPEIVELTQLQLFEVVVYIKVSPTVFF